MRKAGYSSPRPSGGGSLSPRVLLNKAKPCLLMVPVACILVTLFVFLSGRGYTINATQVLQQAVGMATGTPASSTSSYSPGSTSQQTTAKWQVDQDKAAQYRPAHGRHQHLVPGGLVLNNTAEAHCPVTLPGWCGPYWTQPLLPPRPPPRHDKRCPNDCNRVGVCDHSTGICRCPAGWQGDGCEAKKKRICHNMGPDKRDLNLTEGGWVHTRCSGACDDDFGMCYCPPETKYGRKWAPDAKPGDKPIQEGRPMYWCNPNTTADGQRVPWSWNTVTYEGIFGPNGYCNAEKPVERCNCALDGVRGHYCDIRVTQFCPNQCTGNGECQLGFCKCRDGWFGHDCSQRRKGLPFEEPGVNRSRTQSGPMSVATDVPAAIDPPVRPFRRRPFIYVYELPPRYNSLMLQYRIEAGIGIYRMFDDHDKPYFIPNGYSLDSFLHELMLTSEHRTFDPEEADYFYVPSYISALADMVGKAPEPFWPVDENGSWMWSDRAYRMSMMAYETKKWMEHSLPYWNRTGGRDHIWLFSHDEAPCYQHHELWNSIWLTHWGRLDFPHKSGTQYGPDNYSWDKKHKSLPHGWIAASSGKHPCHDPVNHLVVPGFKSPQHYLASPYMGKRPVKRDILAFFRGDMRLDRDPHCAYSRCIRQTLYNLSKEHSWKEKYNVWYGGYKDTEGSYSDLLSRSKFCLVLPGDGWSPRMEDSMLHGCVPVIIQDNILLAFETLLDFSKFAVRVAEKDMAKLVDILLKINDTQYEQMQNNVNHVWMRYRWNSLAMVESELHTFLKHNTGGRVPENNGTQWTQTGDDDAMSTVMQWLYHRLPEMDRLHHPHKSGGRWTAPPDSPLLSTSAR